MLSLVRYTMLSFEFMRDVVHNEPLLQVGPGQQMLMAIQKKAEVEAELSTHVEENKALWPKETIEQELAGLGEILDIVRGAPDSVASLFLSEATDMLYERSRPSSGASWRRSPSTRRRRGLWRRLLSG